VTDMHLYVQRTIPRVDVGDKVVYVQVRHEEMPAFMACGHSKFTGEVTFGVFVN